MCDLFSWIKDKDGKIWFNKDEDLEIAGMDFNDGIGHSAIEYIWKVSGEHQEGVLKVPPELAKAVNQGHCDKMAKSAGWAGIRYTKTGNINVSWWPKQLIKEAKTLKYFDNHDVPLAEWKLFETRNAAGCAAWGAALDAAGCAAWGAARGAALDAARGAAWGAALDAARGAALDAARGAALDAARGAALDAARGAALLAQCELAFFENKENPHLLYAQRRWEVYKRGYGVLCDVEGILYVYKKS